LTIDKIKAQYKNKALPVDNIYLLNTEYMDVILFGISREIVGEKKIVVNPAENIDSVGALKHWLKQKYPQLDRLSSLAVAVDSEYAGDDKSLVDENEVAIIPPVSGG
jgi:molybdopterin synthase sulfur carrier subunit